MTTTTLKKLAEVTQYYFHAYGMTRKGGYGDDGKHTYWIRYSDYAALLQEVETYKRAKQENDERFMLERDEARQEVETLRQQNKSLTYDLFHATAHNGYARQEALEEAAKVCTDHIAWLRHTDVGGVNAKRIQTAETLLDAIRALQHTGEVPGPRDDKEMSTLADARLQTLEKRTVETYALRREVARYRWVSLAKEQPGGHIGKFLVTNNINARDAFGHMSHLWLVSMIHPQQDGSFMAFSECDTKIGNLTHWRAALEDGETP